MIVLGWGSSDKKKRKEVLFCPVKKKKIVGNKDLEKSCMRFFFKGKKKLI